MKIYANRISSAKTRVNIVTTDETDKEFIRKRFVDSVKELAKNVTIKGFRKGKAPFDLVVSKCKRGIIESLYTDILEREITEDLCKENNIKNIMEINKVSAIIDLSTFVVDIIIEVVSNPIFTISDYNNIEVKVNEEKVDEKQVNIAINTILEKFASLEESDIIEIGSICEIQYNILAGEDSVETNKIDVVIEKDKMFEKLVGKKVGDIVNLPYKLDISTKNTEFTEKDAILSVEIKRISKKVLPTLDDAFVNGIDEKYANVAEFKDAIRVDLENRNVETIKKKKIEIITNKLLEENDFEISDKAIQSVSILLEKNMKNRLSGIKQLTKKDRKKILAVNKSACAKQAVEILKLQYILDEIAEKESITASEEELNNIIEKIANKNNVKTTEMAELLKNTGEYGNIKRSILNQKTVELLVERNS